jgi:hypothetical protein
LYANQRASTSSRQGAGVGSSGQDSLLLEITAALLEISAALLEISAATLEVANSATRSVPNPIGANASMRADGRNHAKN